MLVSTFPSAQYYSNNTSNTCVINICVIRSAFAKPETNLLSELTKKGLEAARARERYEGPFDTKS